MSESRIIGGRYRIESTINRGGMGDVYRAVDEQTGQTVAVKTLNRDIVKEDPQLLERFRREADVLRKLEHPNIVKILDTVDDDQDHHIIMEYVSGGSLAGFIEREGKLPIAKAVQIALDLSDALARAHRLNIIHRDIKPANILLADDGTPRLTDFGVAQMGDQQTRLTRRGAVLGTVAYLAPEVCTGADYSEGSDIWSFGVTLYEMLAGRHPFAGERLAEVVGAIINDPLPDIERYRDDVPPLLNALLVRMLAKDPALRIESVRAVGAELEAVARQPAPAPPPPILPPPIAPPPVGPAPVPMLQAAPAQEDGVRVFVCYRREQNAALVDRLVEKLGAAFGRERVFRDMDRLSLRTVSRLVLASDILGNCTHMLVMIGRDWVSANNNALQNPKDIVRVELETAAKRSDLQIVPVLVDGATMPTAEQLPPSLHFLTMIPPVTLSSTGGFDYGVARLIAWARGQAMPTSRWRQVAIIGALVILAVIVFLLLRPMG
jgi:hypothetical protein